MPANYNYSGDPSTTPTDAVRFWVGDTDMRAPQLTDGEISYCLAQNGQNVMMAALMAAYGLLSRASMQVSETVGPVSVQGASTLEGIKAQIALIRRNMSLSAYPNFGGVVLADIDDNTGGELASPWFTRRSFETPSERENDPDALVATDDPLLGDY